MRPFDKKDTIRRPNPFDPADFPHRLAYYEAMAQQGWILTDIGEGLFSSERRRDLFRRGDGRDVRFDIDYRADLYEGSPEYRDYIAACEEKGCRLVTRVGTLYLFRRNAETPPLHDMAEVERHLTTAEKASRSADMPEMFLVVFLAAVWLFLLAAAVVRAVRGMPSYFPRLLHTGVLYALALATLGVAPIPVNRRRIRKMRESLRAGHAPDASDYPAVMRVRLLEKILCLAPIWFPLLYNTVFLIIP